MIIIHILTILSFVKNIFSQHFPQALHSNVLSFQVHSTLTANQHNALYLHHLSFTFLMQIWLFTQPRNAVSYHYTVSHLCQNQTPLHID